MIFVVLLVIVSVLAWIPLVLTIRRRRLAWLYAIAALLGFTGAICAVYADMSAHRAVSSDDTGVYFVFGLIFFGVPLGGSIGAWSAVALLASVLGPTPRRIGAALGALFGLMAGFPLLLRGSSAIFETDAAGVAARVFLASAVLFAVVGGLCGIIWHRRGTMARLWLAGTAFFAAVLVANYGWRSQERVWNHTRTLAQLRVQNNISGLREKADELQWDEQWRMIGGRDIILGGEDLHWSAAAWEYAHADPVVALRHPYPPVRNLAGFILGSRGDRRSIPPLIEMLGDEYYAGPAAVLLGRMRVRIGPCQQE
jgi:hypothetical protein